MVQGLLATCQLQGVDPYTYLGGRAAARRRPPGFPVGRTHATPVEDAVCRRPATLRPRPACPGSGTACHRQPRPIGLSTVCPFQALPADALVTAFRGADRDCLGEPRDLVDAEPWRTTAPGCSALSRFLDSCLRRRKPRHRSSGFPVECSHCDSPSSVVPVGGRMQFPTAEGKRSRNQWRFLFKPNDARVATAIETGHLPSTHTFPRRTPSRRLVHSPTNIHGQGQSKGRNARPNPKCRPR